jgi:hypothetical protein
MRRIFELHEIEPVGYWQSAREKIAALETELALLEAIIESKNATLARMSKERSTSRYVMELTTWEELQDGDFICYEFSDGPGGDDRVWRRKENGR